jgi:uncharacterized coiled-coil protein SlyX
MPADADDFLARLVEFQKQLAHQTAPFAELQRQMAERATPFAEFQKQLAQQTAPFAEIQKQMAERAAPFAEFQKQLAQQTAPFAEIQRQLATQLNPFAEIQREAAKALESHFRVFEEVRRQTEQFAELVSRPAAKFAEMARSYLIERQRADSLTKAGFLPHITTPFHLVDECDDDVFKLSNLIEEYYRDNWTAVRAQLLKRLNSFSIDDEAKHTVIDAIELHELGHYRAVISLLFPEIERVVITELGNVKVDGLPMGPKVPHYLQQIGDEIGISDLELNGFMGLELFGRLTHHLYASVKDKARMEADGVPNRNAALHGLVIYRSYKNSINTIFITDVIFRIVDLIKAQHQSTH